MYIRNLKSTILYFILAVDIIFILFSIVDDFNNNHSRVLSSMMPILIILFFGLTNLIFFFQVRDFIQISHHEKEIKSVLAKIFLLALFNIILFAIVYFIYGINSNSGLIKYDWDISLYFSIVTWTTLGYGDYSPIESLRLIASFEALMGYMYMALIIGLILNVIKINIIYDTPELDYEHNWDTKELNCKISNASSVTILQTWIPSLHVDVISWELAKDIKEFKVLLIDEELIPFRLKERSHDENQVKSNIKRLKSSNINNLEIRCYSVIPFGPVYIIDDDIYWGIYLSNTCSMHGPRFRTNKHTEMGRLIELSVNKIWNNASKVN